ncbi:MAG: penicillin-binding protein 2, partial [Aquihabitans sp.]
ELHDDLDDFFGRSRSRGPATVVHDPVSSARQKPPVTRRARTTGPARTARTTRVAPAAPNRSRVSAPRPAGRPRLASVPADGASARRRTQRRIATAVLFVVVAVAAIGAKLTDLQITGRDRWMAYGLDRRDGSRSLPAGRGVIFDRDGNPLAMSVMRPDVTADPTVVVAPAATAKLLAPVLHQSEAKLKGLLSRDGRYVVLAPTVSPATADQIRKLKLVGINLESRYQRDNPSGSLATSVLGRTVVNGGTDEQGHQGLSGIEKQYDRALTGTPGTLYYEHDPRGGTIAGGQERVVAARPGTNLYLTVDQTMQYETERALAQQVGDTGSTSGMAVITRPSTGEIVSMASVAVNKDGKVTNTRDNRSVTANFEPGSVNKMITIAGALEDGVVEPDTVLQVPDHLRLYDKDFTDHDPHPITPWSVTDILVTSSNIGTIKIARQLGASRVDSYLRAFGLGQTTGLGFPYEENGIMLPLDEWSGTSIGAIPIGQGIAVTALQMLGAYNAIANDGVYVAPKLVAATDTGDGRVPTARSTQRRVVSKETAQAMQLMLEKVVSDGTGKKAQVPGYPAAGKTGTARIPQGIDPKDGYLGTDGRYHYQSTFLGFVSGADLSIIVTLQDPKTSSFGGDVAAPVFSHLASLALVRFQTPPPALVERSKVAVPELSDSARAVKAEDVGITEPAAAG